MECQSFPVQRLLIHEARQLVEQVVRNEIANVDEILERAQRLHAATCFGPSTEAIVAAAKARGIPVRRLNDCSLVQLGYGCKRRLVEATVTDGTSTVGVDIACDKALTKQLLAGVGIPVPEGDVAESVEEAVRIYREMGAPVALKPYDGNQGRGVSLDLRSETEVMHAFKRAATISRRVIVERYVADATFGSQW